MERSPSIRTLQSFSPGWSDPEILEKILAGRRELVDRLEELVIDGVGGPNKHQRLIIGFRGSGKTHVLRVLHNRLWPQEELKKRLLIIYLLEDELGVASFLDFVVRLLRAILRWYPEQNELVEGLEEIYDLPPDMQETRAVQLLLRVSGSKDILIIMENLSIIFDKKKGFGLKGQQALRDLVQQHPRFMIFASSQALAESIKDLNAPFYSFFKVIHLRRLNLDEAMAFLMDIASAYGNQGVVSFLNTAQGRGRMRAIYEFTGGNHRLLVVFYEFLTSDSVAKLSDLFIQALDPLKPFYQEQMRGLSAQQQKIVQFLSLQRNPCTVKDIARACLAAPNTVSSQMKDLLNKNFVSRIVQGRESYYEIAETLFRICQEAELEQEGAPVRLFVDFLGNLYTGEELQLRYRGYSLLANKLGEEGHIPFAEEAALYSRALSLYHPELAIDSMGSGLRETETDELHSLLQEMTQLHAYQEILQMTKYLGEKKDAFILRTEAIAYEELGDTEKAAVHAMEALNRHADDPDAHILLAIVLSRNPEAKDDALNHALRANELMPDNPRALASIGIVYYNGSEYNKALKQFEILKQTHPDYADGWSLCGRALESLERTKEAEAMYRRALELEPRNAGTLERLGILEFDAGRHDEALDHFQALNEIHPDYADGWWLCGRALGSLKRTKEAEAMCRRALELEPKNAGALELLGALIGDAGRHDEALNHFQALNEIRPGYADGWWLCGMALQNLGRTKEAEVMYRKALELEPRNAVALERLGILELNAGRHDEALNHFQALNEIRPEYAIGWSLSGRALESLERTKEAEAMYRRALELEPRNAGTLERLGILEFDAGRHDEALDHFQALNEIHPDYADGWWLCGRALGSLKRTKEAEAMCRRALELEPKNAGALELLGALIGDAGRHDEALNHFQALNEIRPGYADGWWLCGMALQNLGRTKEAEVMYRKALELEPRNAVALERLGILELNAGRHDEALNHFQALNEIRPDYADGWSLCGTALESLGRTKEAEAMYRKALELDPANSNTWASLSIFLENQGQADEAALAFKTAERYGADRAHLLNRRGEARRERGDCMKAIADYEEALQTDPYAVWPHFNIISALIALGRTEDALTRLPFAIESDRMSKTPFGNTITQSFFESCLSLFEHVPTASFKRYLKAALDIIGSYDPVYIQRFEESLPLTIFALLKRNERISQKRFDGVLQSLRNVVGKGVEVRVALRFLQTGIDYFKKKDRKALLKLTKEERRVFSKELGIKSTKSSPQKN